MNGGWNLMMVLRETMRQSVQAAFVWSILMSHAIAADLTINDGVIVKFGANGQMVVHDGIITGKGVIFTSVKDDATGGPVGATVQSPLLGDWRGIKIEASASPVALHNTTIKFGGSTDSAALEVRKISPSMNYVEVSDSSVGIRLTDGANIVFDGLSLFRNGVGLQVTNATPTLKNSRVETNTNKGIENLTPATVVVATGNWWGNANGPIEAGNPQGQGDVVSTGVNYANWATLIPLINPTLAVAGSPSFTASNSITLNLFCRNAVEYRVAENGGFAGVAFAPMTGSVPFTLSSGDGVKQISVQYRAATGNIVTTSVPNGILFDTQGPSLAVTNPANGSYITKSISIDATASDAGGVSKVEFYVDNALVATDTGTPYSYSWDVTNVADGTHTLKTIAYDTVAHSTVDTRTVSLTKAGPPPPDTAGPTLSNPLALGGALADGATLTRSGTISISAVDPSGIARIEFAIDGAVFGTDTNGADGYSAYLNLLPLTDGAHVLSLRGYDSLNNSSVTTLNVVVALAAPSVPTLSAPANNASTNQAQITVTGIAEKGTQVAVQNNGGAPSTPIDVNADGSFSIAVSLVEGANSLQAFAQNRGGASPLTVARVVTRDSSIPVAPTGLAASAQASGKIRLSWIKPNDNTIGGYHLYRSSLSFTDLGEAKKVNSSLITTNTYDDLPPADGTYYYRVVAANTVGTTSTPSNMVSGASDNTMPRALSITYTPTGKVDAATGRIATGHVNVLVKVSEPLLAAPFLSMSPANGTPIPVDLTKQTDTDYVGGFDITSYTPVGTAYAVFSARDVVGNRGTEINSGGSINIDSQGPALTALTVTPGSPIKNDATTPATVNIAFTLNEAMKPGQIPQLGFVIASAPGTETPITNVTLMSGNNWQASFTLPATAGQTQLDNLSFTYRGVDDLDNVATNITASNSFQIYQGNLPALAVPVNVGAVAQPAGAVKISWGAVPDAAAYQLYRQGPNDSDLQSYQRVSAQTEYVDNTPSDGVYRYAVATVRQQNGQESLSALSAAAQATADRVAPSAPTNLVLTLTGSGIYATWNGAPEGDVKSYALYRASTTTITSAAGLTPIKPNLLKSPALDTQPSVTEHSYVVTARDNAGNESAISNSVYLNFALLPVSNLTVVQSNNDLPVVSWTHTDASIAGYDVYLGPDDSRIKLNSARLSQKTFTDTGYVQDERRYTVVAVDTNAAEAAHSIVLPKVTAQLVAGTPLKRGLMNRLQYQITNHSSAVVGSIVLRVKVGAHDHASDAFTLNGGETKLVSIIVGGYSDLTATTSVTHTVEVVPNDGEKIQIARSTDTAVQDGAIVTALATETFTRGATGKVRFTLENTSDVELEVLTATSTGSAPSNELRFKLLDKDGNVLTTQSFKQILGTGVITLANGRTVVRLAPGARFTSDPVDIAVPASAPESVTVQLEIDQLHYHTGQTDAVNIAGFSNRQNVALVDTAYAGEVTSIAPLASFSDQNIIIQGRAVNRATNQPLPSVALKLYLRINGFERKYDVFTDASGNYSFTYTPDAADAGTFKVSAVHPDLLDRPDQGQFVISQVRIDPLAITLNLPRNYNQLVNVKAIAGDGTVANNVRLVYTAADQATGSLTPGVNVALGSPIALASKQTGTLAATITADNSAPATGSFFLTVLSDERGATPLGKIKVDYRFSDAKPALFTTPSFVETGVSQNSSITEQLTLENRGFAAMDGVAVSLTNADGSAAPAWAYITTPAQIGSIAVGEKRTIDLTFAPTTAVIDGIYSFKVKVAGNNIAASAVNVYATVTQSGIGNVLFKAADIYTGTLDKTGKRIQGLAGARIQVQNEQVLTIDQTLATDSFGEAYVTNLPTGRYKFRATATNHQEIIGRFSIKPGVTTTQDVFLDYNLVTVTWSVTEITLQDKYEITLNATYETNVPAAVIALEPASVTLPTLKPGDVFYGELTLTNYGLIRADHVQATLPPSDQYFRFEFLQDIPPTLNAKQRITLPYRAISLQSFEPAGTATGGGCYTYQPRMTVGCDYECANGNVSNSSTGTSWFYTYGSCGGGGAAGGIGGSVSPSSYSFAPPSGSADAGGTNTSAGGTPIGGSFCAPDLDCEH